MIIINASCNNSCWQWLTPAIFALVFATNSFGKTEFPKLEGPYLGQKPPGMTPQKFAPNIIGKKYRDRGISISPELNEIYFSRRLGHRDWVLIRLKAENNQWSESVVMPRVGRPILGPQGKTMYLGRKYMTRTQSGWSDVTSLGEEFEQYRIMRLSGSSKGTLIFDEVGTREGDSILRYSRLNDGQRETPKAFGKQVNTGKFNAHPFVAPDESFFIFDGVRDTGYGDVDLYISFRRANGSWGEAKNMGPDINSNVGDAGGYVSPDGKYFFFNSSRDSDTEGHIYWVDAQVIENLKHN